jgi:bifunctional non-homologous end joining protein LigD
MTDEADGRVVTDQLSLRLDPALPRLPSLRPMLARPLPEPFDSDLHLFEPVWGGARALALIGPASTPGAGDVRIVAEDGTEGPAPIDLAGLAARVDARSAVLDGEIVVVDDAGRLDREAMRARLAGEPGRPMSYLAFDLLDIDGRSLLRLALDKRRALLRQVLRPGDEAVAVPAIVSEGRALYEAVSGQGLYGIRARQRSSPYLPGVRSRLWRTIAVGEAARRAAATGDEHAEESGLPGRAQHVLALIRRLPLEFEEEAERPIEPAG